MTAQLFTPFTLRGLTLDNRIVVSPMGQYSATEGSFGDWHLMHLGSLSVSGAGLLFVEATAVEPRGRVGLGCSGLWSDENAKALGRIIAFCRKHGRAKLGIQLAHSGRKGGVTAAWEKQRPLEAHEGGWPLVSPSALAYPGRKTPDALDAEGLAQVKAAFVAAAERAVRLDFDLAEIHNAHGYLLHSFLTPLANQRNDEYGGDRAGRMRFPLEVFEAVRKVWPNEKPLGLRLSASDWVAGGWDVEDSIVFAKELVDRGCDFICASSGGASPEQQIIVEPGYQVPFAEAIRREAGIPTMAVGLINQPQQAEAIVAEGKADLVALARGMLYDPRWPWHAAVELGEDPAFPPQYERADPAMWGGDFLKPFKGA